MTVRLGSEELQSIEKLREQEMEEARIIQNVMLPDKSLCHAGITLSHCFQPASEVGGDFLDYFTLSDDSVGLYVGDVSGKGLPAALYAALVVGMLRGVHKTGLDPARTLSILNDRMMERRIPGRHTAIQYALFTPGDSQMRVVSAGMPGPLHIRGKHCRVLQIPGIPPGLFAGVEYDEVTLQLEPGDSVLFCTDGLTEARNRRDEEFELEGLQDVCRKHGEASSLELLGYIFTAVEEFTQGGKQADDMTATVFHFADKP